MRFGKAVLITLAVCTLMMAAAIPAAAADLNGSWLVKVETPNGVRETTYTFKVDGKTLTGKVTTQRGDTDIKDGKIDGDSFEFSVERPGRGGAAPTTSVYKGKISGDTITLSTTMQGNPVEMKGERKKM